MSFQTRVDTQLWMVVISTSARGRWSEVGRSDFAHRWAHSLDIITSYYFKLSNDGWPRTDVYQLVVSRRLSWIVLPNSGGHSALDGCHQYFCPRPMVWGRALRFCTQVGPLIGHYYFILLQAIKWWLAQDWCVSACGFSAPLVNYPSKLGWILSSGWLSSVLLPEADGLR